MLNPYAIIIMASVFLASVGGAFWYGHNVGANAEKVACEQRVAALQAAIDVQNKKIDAINAEWEKRIAAVQDTYNADKVAAEQEISDLEKKVTDYEATLANVPACTLDQHDLDSLQ